MRKKYLPLTSEQKARGIIFSSQLMPDDAPVIHEVKADAPNKEETIRLLKDDKFFNDSPWSYNLIRS